MNIEEIKDIEDIKKIKDNLKKSPMFNLSLSSKELFHSNFICWLANEHDDLFWNVIEQICGCNKDSWPNVQGEFEYRRECENFDFSVWNTNGEEELILVIENKVKSLANANQLCEYEDKINSYKRNNKINTHKILLSLANYNPEVNGWDFVPYTDFSKYLEESIKNKTIEPGYHKSLIEDYIAFIKDLDVLRLYWEDEIKNNSEKAFQSDEEMKELRIDDLRQKIIYNTIEKELKEKLKKEHTKKDYLVLDSTKSKDLKELKKEKNSIIERIKRRNKEHPIIFTNTGYGKSGAFVELKFIVENEILKKESLKNVSVKGDVDNNITDIQFARVLQLQNDIFRIGIELLGGAKFNLDKSKKKDADISACFAESMRTSCKFEKDFCEDWPKPKGSTKYPYYYHFEDTFFYRNKKLKDLEELKDYSLNSIVELFISYIPKEKNKELLCTVGDLLMESE